MIRRTLEAAFEDNIPFLASALSFDVILTAIPFLVLLLAVLGYLVQHQITAHQVSLAELLQRFTPVSQGQSLDAVQHVEDVIAQIVAKRGKLTLFGLPLFLYFSTRLFGGLRVALNDVFDTDERRPWPLAKLTDLATMLTTGALLLISSALPALEARAGAPFTLRLGLELVAFAFGTVLFLVIFKVLPSRRIAWGTAFVAAGFCALAFEIAKRAYALYVTRFVTLDHLASDANVAAFFLFLLWVYYTNCVFLIGGEIAEAYDLARMRRAQRVRLG